MNDVDPVIVEEVPGHDHKSAPAVVDTLTREQVEALLDGKALYWDVGGGVCLRIQQERDQE